MADFAGSIHLPGEHGPGLGGHVHLRDDRLRLIAGGRELGDWQLDALDIHVEHDGFHLRDQQEEVVFSTVDRTALAAALGLAPAPGGHPPAPIAPTRGGQGMRPAQWMTLLACAGLIGVGSAIPWATYGLYAVGNDRLLAVVAWFLVGAGAVAGSTRGLRWGGGVTALAGSFLAALVGVTGVVNTVAWVSPDVPALLGAKFGGGLVLLAGGGLAGLIASLSSLVGHAADRLR